LKLETPLIEKVVPSISEEERRVAPGRRKEDGQTQIKFIDLPPAWMKFILFCQSIGHGKIETLQIQDGKPVSIDKVKEKIRFLSVAFFTSCLIGAGSTPGI